MKTPAFILFGLFVCFSVLIAAIHSSTLEGRAETTFQWVHACSLVLFIVVSFVGFGTAVVKRAARF